MKIIFLDIDGVLNHEKWYEELQNMKGNIDIDKPINHIDPKSINELNRIIIETGAKVVISSTWRKQYNLNELRVLFSKVGFVGEILDVTRVIMGNILTHNDDIYCTIPRGCEIDYWLKEYGNFQRINWSKEEQQKQLNNASIKNYIILDDDSDMLYNQREHYIKVGRQYGLTKEIADIAIEILNKSIMELYYK